MWKAENQDRRRNRYQNDKEYRDQFLEYKRKRLATPEGRVKENLSQRKSAAKKRGLDFSVTIDDLLPLPTHCPILGIEIDYNAPIDRKASPSIDRIIPELGYIKGNVIVISNRANTLKRDASIEEIILLADYFKGLGNA